jgi:hypothetical protein
MTAQKNIFDVEKLTEFAINEKNAFSNNHSNRNLKIRSAFKGFKKQTIFI